MESSHRPCLIWFLFNLPISHLRRWQTGRWNIVGPLFAATLYLLFLIEVSAATFLEVRHARDVCLMQSHSVIGTQRRFLIYVEFEKCENKRPAFLRMQTGYSSSTVHSPAIWNSQGRLISNPTQAAVLCWLIRRAGAEKSKHVPHCLFRDETVNARNIRFMCSFIWAIKMIKWSWGGAGLEPLEP